MKQIRKVLIAGGGLMGKNIAYVVSADRECRIAIYDIHPVNVAEGIRQSTQQLREKGVLTEEELEERLSRITFIQNLDCEEVREADLVIEAVFEDMELKQKTFAALEEICRQDCIFCTNTSVMSPGEISRNLKYRQRFCGTHFWNPGHLIPLVEVVRTDATSDETVETVMEFMRRIGKKPCLCNRDVPGFIANRLQHALWREAISMVDQGIADAETVDTAIKNSFGLRLPQLSVMENADLVGLDLTWNIHEYVLPHLEDSHQPSPLLARLKEEGKLGFKSGEGFRKWTPAEQEQVREDLNTYLIRMLYGK